MAIDINKSTEGKPKPRFNLAKSDESTPISNDSNRTSEPKRKFDLSKPGQPAPQISGNKESIQDNTPEKSKNNKTVIFVILGIVFLVAIIWFFANSGKSPNPQNAGIEQPKSKDLGSSVASPSSNSKGNSNSNVADPAQSQAPASTANKPFKETPGSLANNKVQNAPKQEASVSANIPYKKDVSYQVYQFPFGSSDYSQANPELDKLAEVLKQNPAMKISISAYTDDIGDEAYNLSLSQLRAKSIRDYLQNKGIDAGRMTSQGKGISTKYATKAENRRAEFVLSEQR